MVELSVNLTREEMKWARDGAKQHVQRIFRMFPGLSKEISHDNRVSNLERARAIKQSRKGGRGK